MTFADARYAAAWRDLARRRVVMWSLFLGYIPGIAVLCLILSDGRDDLCTRIALAWMLVMGAAIAYAALFRCPRCGGLFCFASAGPNNLLARRCVRCGLAMDQESA